MNIDRKKIIEDMKKRRRDFHHYPETGWTEFRTTAFVADILVRLGYDVHFDGEFIKHEYVMGRNIDVATEKNVL